MNTRTLLSPLTALLLVLPLASCAKEAPKAADGSEKVTVVAAFYPLQYLAEQIGGEHVTVQNLTRPGAEPHDLELSAKDVADVKKARLVVYEKGLQAPVDKAVETEASDHALDVTPAVDLNLKHGEAINAQGDETGSDHEAEEENAPGTTDPHFWLDPVRYGKAARAVADRLKQLDPAHAAQYDANLAALTKRTGDLDTSFSTGLSSCKVTKIVTAHAAFGYLANRYHLTQVSIAGVSAEAEPAPGQLTAVSQYVRKNKITTIYTETLLDPKHAQTVARETGATTAVLDPIEGINDKSAAQDYFGIMEANLAALKKGQQCS